MLRHRPILRVLMYGTALWVVAVQLGGPRATRLASMPPSEATKTVGELQVGESEPGDELGRDCCFVVVEPDGTREYGPNRLAWGEVWVAEELRDAHWSRPPPRV